MHHAFSKHVERDVVEPVVLAVDPRKHSVEQGTPYSVLQGCPFEVEAPQIHRLPLHSTPGC